MNVAILGGAGYLGSIISSELKYNDIEVVINDNMMFCDEFNTISHPVNRRNILTYKCDYSKFDRVVWCIDIDVPVFYTLEESQNYIEQNIKKYSELSKKLKHKLMWVTDFKFNDIHSPYAKMLLAKEDISNEYGSEIVIVPSLYGPSPRMRFDTEVNLMFVTACVQNAIYLDGWMDQIEIQSVAVAGKKIAKSIIDNENVGDIAGSVLSKLEIAHLVKKAVDEKVLVLMSEEMHSVDGVRGTSDKYDDNTEFSIGNSIKYMLNAIEHGSIDSIVKDMYNNSKIIENYISSQGIHALIGDLKR